MTEFLSPVLEMSVILPGLLLAYLPMKQYLKLPPRKLAALAVPFAILLCLSGGALCFFRFCPGAVYAVSRRSRRRDLLSFYIGMSHVGNPSVYFLVCAGFSPVSAALQMRSTSLSGMGNPFCGLPLTVPFHGLECAQRFSWPHGIRLLTLQDRCWRMRLSHRPGMCSGFCPYCLFC